MNRDEQHPEALGWVVCHLVVVCILIGMAVVYLMKRFA